MQDELIKEIVQAVLIRLAAGDPKDAKPIKQSAQPASNQGERTDLSQPREAAGENLEDLAAVDLQQEIMVPHPVDGAALEYYKRSTTARIGVWRCGPRPLTRTLLRFRADHATAQDSVFKDVSEDFLSRFNLVRVQTMVKDKDQYLTRPDLGRQLPEGELEKIRRECPPKPQVQIVIADGLSSRAVEANLADILPALKQGLASYRLATGRDIFVKFGRVGVMDVIGMTLAAEVVVLLVGERPGLGTSESMSAYMIYKPGPETVVADHTVVSNIHKGGTPPAEAGAHLATVVKCIYDAKASGVKLAQQ